MQGAQRDEFHHARATKRRWSRLVSVAVFFFSTKVDGASAWKKL